MSSYNEVTHSQSADINSLDPLYKWDTHFPERLSKLHLHADNTSPVARRSRARRNRNAARFKTQPITFDEIKEVDEESKDGATTAAASADSQTDSFLGIKSELAAFSRSMDGLLPGNRREKTREPSTDSNKENQPSCDSCSRPSESRGLPLTTEATTTSTGLKVPAGLPTERDATRINRRKSRKKAKAITEEKVDEVPGTPAT